MNTDINSNKEDINIKIKKFLKAVEYTDLNNQNDEKTIDYLFKLSCKNVNLLDDKPKNEILLKLYGLYKQSIDGNCNINKPNFLDIKGVKKWESWMDLYGVKSIEAKKRYIFLVELLIRDAYKLNHKNN